MRVIIDDTFHPFRSTSESAGAFGPGIKKVDQIRPEYCTGHTHFLENGQQKMVLAASNGVPDGARFRYGGRRSAQAHESRTNLEVELLC